MKTKAGNLINKKGEPARFSKFLLPTRILWLLVLVAGFILVTAPQAFAQLALPSVCAPPGGESYSSGFSEDNFMLLDNAAIGDSGGKIYLVTGSQAANPNDITIRFTQNVSVNFLQETTGSESHLGWFIAEYDVDKINNATGELGSDSFTDIYGIPVGNFIPSYVYDPVTATHETRYYVDPNMMDVDNNGIPDDRIFSGANQPNDHARGQEVKERLCSSATYDEPEVYEQFSGDPKNTFYLLFQSVDDPEDDGILVPPGSCIFGSESAVESCEDTIIVQDPFSSTDMTLYLGAGPETDPGNRGHFIVDGDGSLNGADMRKNLGRIEGGAEIVFFLISDGDYRNIFFSKRDFNGDSWNTSKDFYLGRTNIAQCDEGNQMDLEDQAAYKAGNPFDKTYYVGRALQSTGFLIQESCWLPQNALPRLDNPFGLTFDADRVETVTLSYTGDTPWTGFSATDIAGNFVLNGYNKFFQHIVGSAPADNPFQWVMGWEDAYNGDDTDHNDVVFIVNRINGGRVESTVISEALEGEDGATIASITFSVSDYVPENAQITYHYSIDNGENWLMIAQSTPEPDPSSQTEWNDWIDLQNWDLISRTSGEGRYYNDRSATISCTDLGIYGKQLKWKAEISSGNDANVPEITDVSVSYTAVQHGLYGRNSPMILGNVIYYGEYESPSTSWDDTRFRGHFKSFEIYAPEAPTGGVTNTFIWDTGEILQDVNPDSRTLYAADITVGSILLEELDVGDGVTSEFNGTAENDNILPYTFTVYTKVGGTDVILVDDGYGNLYSTSTPDSGTLDRSTGDYYLSFSGDVDSGIAIEASYSYYVTSDTLISFDSIDSDTFALDPLDQYIDRFGDQYYHYDFNDDDNVNSSDVEYLKSWVRGWADGSAETTKRWMLGPIDHSVASIIHPPGLPEWIFGTDIESDEATSLWNWIFEPEMSGRRTVGYVGARDGMLHAIDAGAFKQGDNPETSFTEYRGYFIWDDADEPDYGTGEELWAYVPNNLVPKLKNNYLREDDQAFVDSSPSVADISIGDSWHTILVSAQGNGGNNVFALDITDPTTPTFLWEFGDPAIYQSNSSPSIGRILLGGQLTWIACFSAGQNQDLNEYGQIFIVNAANGDLIKRIYLDGMDDSDYKGNTPSGNPVLMDIDKNGYFDRIYIGDDKGIVHRVNIGSSADQIIDYAFADVGQPIYGSLAIRINKGSGMAEIFFGTGDDPQVAGDIPTGEGVIYYFYAFRDPYGVDEVISEPYDTEFVDPEAVPDERVGLIWKLALDAGQRIWTSAFAAAEQVYFGTTASDTDDPCAPKVDTSLTYGKIYSVDVTEGTLTTTEEVGNITSSPVVWDQHLYFRNAAASAADPETNSVAGRGDPNAFNNPMRGSFNIKFAGSWREIL